MMLKIVQVLPTLSAGGAEGFVANLGVSLAELGADVRFFLLAGARGERGRVLLGRLADAGVGVLGADERNIRSPRNLWRLARLIGQWRPDVVQANLHSAEVACVAARPFAAAAGASYVRRLAVVERRGSRRLWARRVLASAFRLTIACSAAVAADYREFVSKRNVNKLVTIRNGGRLADQTPTGEQRGASRRALGIPPDAFVVCHVGRIAPGTRNNGTLASSPKAQDVLLKAFSQAFAGDGRCALVVVGDGPLREEAQALAERLKISRQVYFLGQQPEPWPALRAADLFCFPSRHEGLPNALPEAASCALPIVASDIPAVRELNATGSWLLRPVDDVAEFAAALRLVRRDQSHFARKAREEASQIRERFSMNACAAEYLKAYQAAGAWGR